MKKKTNLLITFSAVAFFAVTAAVYAAQDTIPPSIPMNISSSITAANQIYVSWDPSTDNVGVIGYYLYRNGKLIAITPGYTYYTDEPGGGSYSYTVSAYDAAGNTSPQSAATSPLTLATDTTPPSTPTDLTATVSSSSVALSWSNSDDDTGVVGYYVTRNGASIITSDPISSSNYTDTGLTPGVTYRYSVTAYDAAGNVSGVASVSATTILDVTPPTAPTGLSLTAISPTEIDLTWQPATDNRQVAGYDIYRNGIAVGTADSPSYEDTNLDPQTNYQYAVDAYDEVGNVSRQSNPAVLRTPAPDLTPPSIPGNLSAKAVSGSEVDLFWQPSTDNIGVTGYHIYRNGDEIDSTASSSYKDTASELATSTTYDYAVVAYDAAGNLSPQTSVGVTTPSFISVVSSSTSSSGSGSGSDSGSSSGDITPTSTPQNNNLPVFTATLYFGLRSPDVTALQNFLIQNDYLGPNYATGYFGALTQKAVQSFQCAQNVVCSGSPAATGWGYVGPRTRVALNSFGS